jgi:hypothetical protein
VRRTSTPTAVKPTAPAAPKPVFLTSAPQPVIPTPKPATKPDFEIVDGVLKKYNGKGGDVTIPAGVTVIGASAFSDCADLNKLTLPMGVTEIEKYAFYKCVNLTEVTIPNTLKALAYGAFLGCDNVKKMSIPVAVLAGVPLKSTVKELRITGIGKIHQRCLKDASMLSKVIIEKGITAIDDAAFEFCHKLSSVTLPAGLVSIGGGAFWKCDLRSIRIPKSVKSIGKNAFFGNSILESVVFECEDAELGADLFWDCSNLREITCPASMEKKLKKQFGIFERKKINFISPLCEAFLKGFP